MIGDAIAEFKRLEAIVEAATETLKKAIEPYKAKMDAIENALKAELVAQNLNSFKSDAGTAYLSHVLSVKVDDPEKFLEFVKAGHWEFLDARPLKEPVKAWLAENSEEINGVTVQLKTSAEIGLKTTWNINLNIRRSS